MNEAAERRINCFKCRHYYVTWDEVLPRGCKAMGFKSIEMPSTVVYASSGEACRRFEPGGGDDAQDDES